MSQVGKKLRILAWAVALLTLAQAVNEVSFDIWDNMGLYGMPWLPGSNYWLSYSAIATSLLFILILRIKSES